MLVRTKASGRMAEGPGGGVWLPPKKRRLGNLLAAAGVTLAAWIVPPAARAADLWQTYMTAAQQAGADKDLVTEAILERAALDLAETHAPQSLRTMLTRFPLIITYVRLQRDDLWKAAGLARFGGPIGTIDEELKDYIPTLHDFAVKYRECEKAEPDTEQLPFRVFHYGATNAFKYEVMLRTKLMPDDLDLLARAEAYFGLSVAWTDARGAEAPYGEAMRHFEDAQLRRDVLEAASNRFLMNFEESNPAASLTAATVKDRSENISLDQVSTFLIAGDNLVWQAKNHLNDRSSDLAEAELRQAEQLYTQLTRSLSELEASWPGNPLLGDLAVHLAALYAAEFRLTKYGAGQYQGALENAKNAFEAALKVYAESKGNGASEVRDAVKDYTALLLEAGQRREAEELARRYKVGNDVPGKGQRCVFGARDHIS